MALVPTMGALHQGHIRLLEEARRIAGFTVVSIFINPTQFGPGEDLDKYPRDLEGDLAKLADAGADLVFTPDTATIYPASHLTEIRVREITAGLCGAFRPVHFGGVATVVAMLFNLTSPCKAIFGRKDYQQFKVVTRMARDLFMPVEIIDVHTVREPDGLAMSSRNAYLSKAERNRAAAIPMALKEARMLWSRGERCSGTIRGMVMPMLLTAADRIDYVDLYDPEDLVPISDNPNCLHQPDRALFATALHIGKTRLIDNTVLGEPDPNLDS